MKKQIKLSLSIDEAKLLYNGASLERKFVLEEFFPELKPQPITDRVQTYKDALEVLRRKHFDENNLYPSEIASRKLEIIIEALNEGWKPNFNDPTQSKWYCYFTGSTTGLKYLLSTNSPTIAYSSIGVRLCLKDKKLADYTGEQFLYLYKEMLLR